MSTHRVAQCDQPNSDDVPALDTPPEEANWNEGMCERFFRVRMPESCVIDRFGRCRCACAEGPPGIVRSRGMVRDGLALPSDPFAGSGSRRVDDKDFLAIALVCLGGLAHERGDGPLLRGAVSAEPFRHPHCSGRHSGWWRRFCPVLGAGGDRCLAVVAVRVGSSGVEAFPGATCPRVVSPLLREATSG